MHRGRRGTVSSTPRRGRRPALPRLADVSTAAPAVSVDGLVMRYGDKVAVDGLSLEVARGSITAVLGPNGAGQDHDARDLRGLPRPAAGHGPRARPRPAARPRGPAPPHRRDAAGGRRVERRTGPTRCSTTWRRCTPTRSTPRCSASGSAWPTAAVRPTAGCPAASSSGSASRSRWSAARSWSSSTSRRPGMDPQARRTTWELLEEVRADGVTVVLTTHHMDEAEHLADRIHIIDRGTRHRQRDARRADPRGPLRDHPARRQPALPRRRPRVAARRARPRTPRSASSTRSAC